VITWSVCRNLIYMESDREWLICRAKFVLAITPMSPGPMLLRRFTYDPCHAMERENYNDKCNENVYRDYIVYYTILVYFIS